MEEEQKFEVSGPEEPKKKGSKKGLIIAIIIVLILALAGGAYYYFFVNKSTKLQLSDKDKIVNSLDKIEAKVDEITDGNNGKNERKISDNLLKKPFKNKYTITGKINEIDIDTIKSSDVETAKQLISGQQIVIEGQGNFSENKFYAELTAMGQKLGNLVFSENVIGVQVPSVESKYYAIFKNSLETSKYKDLAEIFNLFKYLTDDSIDIEKLKLTEKEEKHYKDTYGKILEKYVTDDKISKESTEITVDGKSKKCDKVVYSIDNETIKSILKEYVETAKNDKEGQDIIINKVLDFADSTKILEAVGVSKDQLKSQVTIMLPEMFDEVISGIDEIVIEKAEIVVYATGTETYKIELVASKGEKSLNLSVELREKGMKISMNMSNEELMVVDVENGNDGLKATIEMEGGKIEITSKEEKDNEVFSIKATVDTTEGKTTMELKATTKINTDTDNKLDEDIELALIAEANGEKVDVALNINKVVEIVESISIPEVTKENAIDIVKEGYLDAVMNEITGSSPLNYNTGTNNGFNTTPSTPGTTTNNNALNTNVDANSIVNELNDYTTNGTNVDINSLRNQVNNLSL